MTRTAIIAAVVAACGASAFSQTAQSAEPNPPAIKFKAESPLQLPDGRYMGEAAGVALNSKGHIFVFARGNSTGPAYAATAAQLLEFDSTGKFIREVGQNFYAWSFAHAVRVDKDDNIWVVDKGSNTVVKFLPDGRFGDIYGRKEEASDFRNFPSRDVPKDLKAPVHRLGLFDQPTDIAWDSKGNSYVTDGYENSRVAKISKDGFWVKSWGERGTGPSQFLHPHGVAIDAKDNIYVADRGNARVQVFDTDGKFIRQFTLMGQVPAYVPDPKVGNPLPFTIPAQPAKPRGDDPKVPKAYLDAPQENISMAPGAPDAMCITPGANPVLYIADINPSRIYKVSLEGKVLGMMGNPGGKLGEYRIIHALHCVDDKTLWVGDLFNWRAQKITMQ